MDRNYQGNTNRRPQQPAQPSGFSATSNMTLNFGLNYARLPPPPQFPAPMMPPFEELPPQHRQQQSTASRQFAPPPLPPPAPTLPAQRLPPTAPPPFIQSFLPPMAPVLYPQPPLPTPHGFYHHAYPPVNQQCSSGSINEALNRYHEPKAHEGAKYNVAHEGVQPSIEVEKDGFETESGPENSDRRWINNWLKSVAKDEIDRRSSQPTPRYGVKISEMKDMMVTVSRLLAELESMSKSLSVVHKSLDDGQWKVRCEEIDGKKIELSAVLNKLSNDKVFLADMKRKLDKRRKKREREKKQRLKRKDENNERRVRREQLHLKMDTWLEDMQDSVERGRREEEMKREADSILADVTRKKAEAKRQISLLSALSKLRHARVVARIAMGQAVLQQPTDAFNNVTGHLKKLWTKQLDGYLMEERGLKVMLNEAAAEEKNTQALRSKMAIKQWEAALFGECNAGNSEFQPKDFEALVSVRKEWDRFIACEGSVMSSSIPTGWVLPATPSDDGWKKMLTAQN